MLKIEFYVELCHHPVLRYVRSNLIQITIKFISLALTLSEMFEKYRIEIGMWCTNASKSILYVKWILKPFGFGTDENVILISYSCIVHQNDGVIRHF